MTARASDRAPAPAASAGAAERLRDRTAELPRIVLIGAVLFFAFATATSYARWADFAYRTFDLAYYVQALWQLLHGRFEVSIEHVPLLGNHVEPIVFLFVPLFAIVRHPMVFVVVQNAALAAMCPIGYDIARRLGFPSRESVWLSLGLLVAPATGYVAVHEFHPEALSAPFLLLMVRARMRGSVPAHWLWFCAILACKENMALLLAAYCVVGLLAEQKRTDTSLVLFYVWPLLLATVWFIVCTKVITPALNSGSIDYLALYARLGGSAGEILRNVIREPHRITGALATSLREGNLVTATLLPFLCLPLLKPRWLLVALPVLLQHLLSWRSSEWQIYFHYAAPLIPLFWIAAVEGLAWLKRSRPASALSLAPPLMLGACIVAQAVVGPAGDAWRTASTWRSHAADRAKKNAFLSHIPSAASVLAPLPYLSHLALREHCYSLHYVLKGLKTLSRARYEPPPPTDVVLIDYGDSATFDPTAGYYHPKMKTADGVLASSDELLHDFLVRATWIEDAADELVLLSRRDLAAPDQTIAPADNSQVSLGEGTILQGIRRSSDSVAVDQPMTVVLDWTFKRNRQTFPWLELVFTSEETGQRRVMTKGLCAPQILEGPYRELWRVTPGSLLPPGVYTTEARFIENTKRAWAISVGGADRTAHLLCRPLPLGRIVIGSRRSSPQ